MINLVSGELISTRVIDPTVDTGDLQTKKVEEISLLTHYAVICLYLLHLHCILFIWKLYATLVSLKEGRYLKQHLAFLVLCCK